MLTPEQIKARAGKLTASRIACLMAGDRERINQLWLEMIGEAQPEDLSEVWVVRMGELTEPLQLEWYERRNKPHIVERRGEVVVHPIETWAAATLDGWIDQLACPIECKFSLRPDPIEVLTEYYQAQMHWQMFVTGATQCLLSITRGGAEPIVIDDIKRDEAYTTELVKRGRQFMWHVTNRIPPVAIEPAPPPVEATKIYDFSNHNQWASSAFDWLDTLEAASENKNAEKILKSLMPTDARKCFGAGVRITRDRAGRLSLRVGGGDVA